MDSALRYRPEVDGLRAVAVVAVILFHSGLGPVAGGFVGVDVFFVISGYLITSTIVTDLETGRFSLSSFYERRARRLLPALFVVMAACVPPAYILMLPNDLRSFGQSLAATNLFLNNALLLHTSGYWSLPAEFKPLLHTWSLGIEGQYYILFPLLMLPAWRYGRSRIVIWVIAGAVASFAAAQWLIGIDRAAAFYLAPTRAWEFLAGSLVTVWYRRPTSGELAPWVPQVMSALGLCLLVVAMMGFDASTPHPGPLSIVPVGGAVLILLFAVPGTMVFRLLTHRLSVGIGLISYSLYLWHLPLIAFARIFCIDPPSPALLATLVGLAVPIAYLSWRFVERPFRSRRIVGTPTFAGGAALLSAAFIGCGAYLHRTDGLPGRLSPHAVSADAIHIGYNERAFRFKRDAFVQPDARHVLVLGNSFARDFVNMLTETFDQSGMEIVYRDDLGGCLAAWVDSPATSLMNAATVIVFASRSLAYGCVDDNIRRANGLGKRLFYSGSKHFGANLNWIMRLSPETRADQFNPLLPSMVQQEQVDTAAIPHAHFLSLLAPILRDGRIPITDGQGRLLSQDRKHLTRYGARYIGEKALHDSALAQALRPF